MKKIPPPPQRAATRFHQEQTQLELPPYPANTQCRQQCRCNVVTLQRRCMFAG